MDVISVPGARLAFDQAGAGTPLVLVHGTGARASSWGGLPGDLAAGGYRVIAYDRRGYGRSAHPPVRDYRVHVDDLAAVLAFAGEPAHVLGWSSGGNTALALAVRRPALFRSLVVMEAPWHGLRAPTPAMLGALARAKVAQVRGRARDGAVHFLRWASGLTDGTNTYDAMDAAHREELLAHAAVILAELDPHPFGLMMEHIPSSRLSGLPFPVTWLLGDASMPWYGKLHGRVARAAPAIRTARVPGGHIAHLDDPEAYAAAVLRAVAARP
jgi:pimeloyl-ACP methyl ester carboxylesterase